MRRPPTDEALCWAVCAAVAGAGIALLVWTWPASAHTAPQGWAYDYSCCSNRDCNELEADRVKETDEGYQITIRPGDHDFVKKEPVRFLVPYDDPRIKDSPDGAPHFCMTPSLKLLCFYRPPAAF